MPDPIQPSPIPVSISIGSSGDAIVFQFATAAGVGVYFVPKEQAREIFSRGLELVTGIALPSLASQLADQRFKP